MPSTRPLRVLPRNASALGLNGIGWEVVQAQRCGGHAVHYIRVRDGNVDASIVAFTPGKEVIVSLGQDGWARRYDHVCGHV